MPNSAFRAKHVAAVEFRSCYDNDVHPADFINVIMVHFKEDNVLILGHSLTIEGFVAFREVTSTHGEDTVTNTSRVTLHTFHVEMHTRWRIPSRNGSPRWISSLVITGF